MIKDKDIDTISKILNIKSNKTIRLNDELDRLRKILNTSEIKPHFKSTQYNNIVNTTRDFYDQNNIKLHDINYIKPSSPLNTHHVNLIKKYSQITSPYNINIIPENDIHLSKLEMVIPKVSDSELSLYNPTFKSIKLNTLRSNITNSLYTSEIARTQIESNKGLINDINNKDVIEILIEFIISYSTNEDIFNNDLLYRLKKLIVYLNNIKDNLSFGNTLESSINISSTLKALKLFNIYKSSNNNIKSEMLNNIGKVFNQELSVEDFLNIYNINLNNSVNINYIKNKIRTK